MELSIIIQILPVEYDIRTNCSHMTSVRCNWLRSLHYYAVYISYTNNEKRL